MWWVWALWSVFLRRGGTLCPHHHPPSAAELCVPQSDVAMLSSRLPAGYLFWPRLPNLRMSRLLLAGGLRSLPQHQPCGLVEPFLWLRVVGPRFLLIQMSSLRSRGFSSLLPVRDLVWWEVKQSWVGSRHEDLSSIPSTQQDSMCL